MCLARILASTTPLPNRIGRDTWHYNQISRNGAQLLTSLEQLYHVGCVSSVELVSEFGFSRAQRHITKQKGWKTVEVGKVVQLFPTHLFATLTSKASVLCRIDLSRLTCPRHARCHSTAKLTGSRGSAKMSLLPPFVGEAGDRRAFSYTCEESGTVLISEPTSLQDAHTVVSRELGR